MKNKTKKILLPPGAALSPGGQGSAVGRGRAGPEELARLGSWSEWCTQALLGESSPCYPGFMHFSLKVGK